MNKFIYIPGQPQTDEFILEQKALFKKQMHETFYDLTDHPNPHHPYEFVNAETNERWMGWIDLVSHLKLESKEGIFLNEEKAKEVIDALDNACVKLKHYAGTELPKIIETLDRLSDELHDMITGDEND